MSEVATKAYPLELRAVSKKYGRAIALENISIHIKHNEVLGLIGENGAGKSTLLKILGGVHLHDAGEFQIGGTPAKLKDPKAAALAGIGVVHQEQSLLDNLSVAENLFLGAASVGADEVAAPTRFGLYRWGVIEKLGAVALDHIGSKVAPKELVGNLSFADKQMVEIAKAVQMASRPGMAPIIILDEPTSVLEKDDIARLEEEIARLRKIGSVIFVSHRLDEIRRICDRVYVLRAGKVVAERNTAEIDTDELFQLMTGREAVIRAAPPISDAHAGAGLQVDALTRKGHYDNVSLQVKRGRVHVLVGAKNSGREEFCRAIFGIERCDSGEIRLNGAKLDNRSVSRAIAAGVGYLPAERKKEGMVAGLSVLENMHLTHPVKGALPYLINQVGERQSAAGWIEKLDVRPSGQDLDIGSLSGGNAQKVVLAKWARSPSLRLMVLDHPTRGLDPGAREHVQELIAEMCQRGVAVLLLADSLDEALAIAHQISVMKDGRISAFFDIEGGEKPSMAQLVQFMV